MGVPRPIVDGGEWRHDACPGKACQARRAVRVQINTVARGVGMVILAGLCKLGDGVGISSPLLRSLGIRRPKGSSPDERLLFADGM